MQPVRGVVMATAFLTFTVFPALVVCAFEKACVQNPCENGGRCVPMGDRSYQCKCIGAFYGLTCEMRRTTEHPSTPGRSRDTSTYLGIVIVMLAVLLLGLIGCVFCYCRHCASQTRLRHNRHPAVHRNPSQRSRGLRFEMARASRRNSGSEMEVEPSSGVANVSFVSSADLPPPYSSLADEYKNISDAYPAVLAPPSYEEAVSSSAVLDSENMAAASSAPTHSRDSSTFFGTQV
ncbi:hypothetical protein BaRGS_00003991 [Batillaria attramentaria]|uniref:EGF-like domain-containing protein n=1 Tax=Batillaria attramentaria TaxID=370345 RepID=A0ABD0M0Z3_9CAEN